MDIDSVRARSGQALVASDGAATHLHPSGFDPSRVGRLCYEGDYPPVEQRDAERAAGALIDHYFKNSKGDGVLVSIPADPKRDTDLLLTRYLREADRTERAFRIHLWNEARAAGKSQDAAISFVNEAIRRAKAPPAIAVEARQGRDAEERPDPKDDSAGPKGHRP